MTRVHLVRTHWAHWGAHSGINQFVKYLDPSQVDVREQLVVDGNRNWRTVNTAARPVFRRFTSDYYKLSDLVGEVRALAETSWHRPDVLHFLDGDTSAQLVPHLGGRQRRMRVMASYHQPPDILRQIVSPRLARSLDRIIAVSPDQTEFFASLVGHERTSTILHGIDTDFFRPTEPLEAPRRVFRCLTVGFWLRDFELLGRITRRLYDFDVEFHIVAPEVGALDITSRIKWHRHISDIDLLALYQQCDVLLLPLTAATANNALLEGLACGLPILTTELSSVKAYLGDAEAILAARGDERALVDGIIHLQSNTTVRERMGQTSRRRAEQLDWRHIASQYEHTYSQ